MKFDVLIDPEGAVKEVIGVPEMLSVVIRVGDNKYVRVDVSTKFESKKDMLEAFVHQLDKGMNEFIESESKVNA